MRRRPPSDTTGEWCQRAFLQAVRPLLTTLTPGSAQREADLATLMLSELLPCVHVGPAFDPAHEQIFALVGTRTPDDAARRIERGVL